jgi:hypothetical protein
MPLYITIREIFLSFLLVMILLRHKIALLIYYSNFLLMAQQDILIDLGPPLHNTRSSNLMQAQEAL